jgi:hypothetical protein
MALTINSPGVQIIETDLSNYQNIVNGTTTFIAGFAPQGPTDEVIQVTTAADLDTIFGTPTTPAERYFYYSCKQVLNSPGNLLTTRLPYGSGSGYGFAASTYSALFFPVASANGSFTIGTPTHVTLTEKEHTDILNGNVNWSGFNNGQAPVTTVTTTTGYSVSSVTVPTSAAMSTIGAITAVQLAANIVPESFTEVFNVGALSGTYTFTFNKSVTSTTLSTTQTFAPATASWSSTTNVANAGFIVLNNSQTTIDEQFQGYYLTVTDNTQFGPNSDFVAVTSFNTLTGADAFAPVLPKSQGGSLGFELSAGQLSPGSQSVSQQIERAFSFDFSQAGYNDCVTINLFKVRSSIYDPSQLVISPVETYVGSFNQNRKIADSKGGNLRSFYLQDIIDGSSANITLHVNPAFARTNLWGTQTDITKGNVQLQANTNAVYPVGVYLPSYLNQDNKHIGNVYTKVNNALRLINSPEDIKVDLIADAGLSTIFANTATGQHTTTFDTAQDFDDTKYISDFGYTGEDQYTQRWLALWGLFNDFCEQTRKDCMFIADPLRQIFVTGKDTKVLSIKGNTFTQNVYTPLQAAISRADSNYSAVYGNWLKSYDSYSDTFAWLPASGFVSAIYSRSDAATQPWFAPAGLNRGILTGVTDIAVNPNQKQRDYLYLISVNPIAYFSSGGYVVYGQKTQQAKPSAFDRVNVRRLFLTLERAVQNTIKYFVFEPNTDYTRTRVINTISPIFNLAKNTQGLYDYLIVCDTRNNTPDVIDRNELAVDIYLKPVKAAEFILVNFIATRTGQNFSELI